ncbi:hypothetical protein K450DRAFT_258853 [Umbelopsis ramanniana AG]|uniref:RecQ-mediated genome instability protein 1 n=1 Tax=Umbelopsis ramanniana AG TaxID=1314678 RepID=A0AAD5E373_UMBRA|nr:uncharacterized protein K450DRAFT_258853 [Umbelopsis ramanniana AG]KAI8575992.1 hypothetical protein K450DRAFT_258853 [Umbelopsis ramanniana AG]
MKKTQKSTRNWRVVWHRLSKSFFSFLYPELLYMSRHAQLSTALENRYAIHIEPVYLTSLISDKSKADNATTERQIYDHFLKSNMSTSSLPVIPPNFGHLHDVLFPGSPNGTVLQINSIMDVENSAQSLLNTLTASTPVRQVYHQPPTVPNGPVNFPRGTLKLEVTDGYKIITALEFRRIPSLSMNTYLGTKILVKNCRVSRGTLMIEPGTCQLLGGDVPSLYHGDMRKDLERRLRTRLGLPVSDEQEDNKDEEDIKLEPQMYDDMDSVFNNVLIDDVMDVSGLTDNNLAPEIQVGSPPLALEPDTKIHKTHSSAEPLEENSRYSNVSFSDFSMTDVDGDIQGSDHSGNRIPNNEFATITRSPVLSQEFGHLDLIEDDDDVVMIKEEKIKQEGTVQTSVSQLIRIYNSRINKESEWQQINRVIVQSKVTRLGQLRVSKTRGFYTVGSLRSEQRKTQAQSEINIFLGNNVLEPMLGASAKSLFTNSGDTNIRDPSFQEKYGREVHNRLGNRMMQLELDMKDMQDVGQKYGEKRFVPKVVSYKPC